MGNNIRSSSRPEALPPRFLCRRWRTRWTQSISAWIGLSSGRGRGLAEMMEEDATTVCGARHRRMGTSRLSLGRTHSEIGYHGGKVKVPRPRVRDRAGQRGELESWQALRDGNLLLEWALNLMVLNVSTRKYHRRGPSARGRPGESAWRRHLEVGRSPALCGAVTQEDEGLARLGSLGTRPASHPD